MVTPNLADAICLTLELALSPLSNLINLFSSSPPPAGAASPPPSPAPPRGDPSPSPLPRLGRSLGNASRTPRVRRGPPRKRLALSVWDTSGCREAAPRAAGGGG